MPYVLNPTTGQLDWTNAAGATLPIAESDVTNLTTDLAAKQPLDSDLTAIAALTTTSFGRSLLAQADAAATRSTIGAGTSSVSLPIAESDVTSLTSDLAAKAPLASPALSGTPTVPTAAVDTNTTQAASTAMVLAQAASATPAANGVAAVGTSTRYARGDHVHATDTTRASTAHHTTHEPGGSDAMAVDAAAATGSLRTLGTASTKAAPGDLVSAYRTLLVGGGRLTASSVSGTKWFCVTSTADVASGTMNPAANSAHAGLYGTYVLAADHAISGLTTKLRVRIVFQAQNTAPNVTVTFGLYPVTIGTSVLNLGTVTSGSTVVFTTPASNTLTVADSTDFTIPSDGFYSLGYITNGTPAAGASFVTQLQLHNV